MEIKALDHLVLTVRDLEATRAFYTALGLHAAPFTGADGTHRWALSFGAQKINLHQAGAEFEPKARAPQPGSADLCFEVGTSLADVAAHLAAHGLEVEDGPVSRTGARGPMRSLYLRDPDGNLIELSRYGD